MERILLELEDVLKESGAYFAAGLVYSTYERFGEDDPIPGDYLVDRASSGPGEEWDEITPADSSDEENAAEPESEEGATNPLANDQAILEGMEEEFILESSTEGMLSIENDLAYLD